MKDTFFITTAIDYTNGKPHIGHAYEKILADIISRYQRLRGEKVYFLTGLDQHGQKIQKSASELDLKPSEYVDNISSNFKNLWSELEVKYDGWATTVEDIHKNVVKEVLQRLFDRGKIYKKKTSGFYSVRQEQFLTDKEKNDDGSFDEIWGEVIFLEEDNYYFKLSDSFLWLKELIEKRPDLIIPSYRASDILNAIDIDSKDDLCISRPKNRLSWGIELPFDNEYVTYVWFDALINYISFSGYLKDKVNQEKAGELPDFHKLWPCDIHIIGKDILRPAHGIYWLIMLHEIGFSDDKIPKLLVHGWWNIQSDSGKSEKMSKSLGNVVDPFVLNEKYGSEGVRYYLSRDIVTGKDANFDISRLEVIYNSELANGFGNLVSRSLSMANRYRNGELKNFPKNDGYDDILSKEIREGVGKMTSEYISFMNVFQVSKALESIFSFITLCNQYVEKTSPWTLAKSIDKEESSEKLDCILYHLCESIVHISVLLSTVLPKTFEKISEFYDIDIKKLKISDLKWGILKDSSNVSKPSMLFPRLAD